MGHVILKYHGQLVSVLVTNSDGQHQGHSTQSEALIVSGQSDGYQMAQFQTARHIVSVVSGLSDSENLLIAQSHRTFGIEAYQGCRAHSLMAANPS